MDSTYCVAHCGKTYYKSLKVENAKKYNKHREFLPECKWFPVCPVKSFYEQGELSRDWIRRYCQGNWENCVRYHMEERGEYHPDRMLPDGTFMRRGKDF